jgi:hypothetical protein
LAVRLSRRLGTSTSITAPPLVARGRPQTMGGSRGHARRWLARTDAREIAMQVATP